MRRKIGYYLQILPLMRSINNWPDIIRLYLQLKKTAILFLRSGERFRVSHYLDALTIKEIYIDREYFMPLDVQRIKTVVDVGANIGTFTVLAGKTFPRAKVIAFEPALQTFKLLRSNLELNKIENVVCVRAAISNHSGSTSFWSYPASGLGSLFSSREGGRPESVQMLTLRQVFSRYHITTCDLLKLDCEGAEYDILSTDKQVLKQVKNVVLEYHDELTDHRHEELVKILRRSGFSIKSKPHPLETGIGIIYARR